MIISNEEYDSVLFVHIPKTAGSSISKILNENNLDTWKRGWPRHHDPYFYLKEVNDINDKTFSFSVVRNPYTRTYSCFGQYKKYNRVEIPFLEYLTNIQENKISQITPLLHLPQSFYIIEQKMLQVTKLYNFENLAELEHDFEWTLGKYNVGNYMVQSYKEDYTEQTIQMTRDIYIEDFNNFGYPLEFEKSLEAL